MPAQTGKDRFGAESPATGSNLENPARPALRLVGRNSERRPARHAPRAYVQGNAREGRQVATGGSGTDDGPPTGKSLQWIERLRRSSSRRSTVSSKAPASSWWLIIPA